MSRKQPRAWAADAALAIISFVIGAGVAGAYAAWRGVSGDSWAEVADALLFPGTLILAAIAAVVWLGWKANID